MQRFITGDRFQKIADMTFSLGVQSAEDYCNLQNTFAEKRLKEVNLIYTHTGYVKYLYEIIKKSNKEFVVITHNSDVNVTSDYIIPPNVRKWFTTNVNALDGRLESIPIGLENDRWFPELKKKEKMLAKMELPRVHKNLVYMNHNIRNNISERTKPYEAFLYKSYCTVRMGSNGQGFDDYLDNIYSHVFVVCPNGNGMDTHRLWETLYMGSIPIVKRDLNNRFYKDLPICFIDSWDEIDEEFLCDERDRMFGQEMSPMLEFDYWKNKINSL